MLEEFWRRRPLIRLELPCLTGRKDGHQARPVLGLEIGRTIDKNKLGWLGATSAGATGGVGRVGLNAQWSLDLHEIGISRHTQCRVIWRYENTLAQKGLDVRHADERGGGWGKKDNRIRTRA